MQPYAQRHIKHTFSGTGQPYRPLSPSKDPFIMGQVFFTGDIKVAHSLMLMAIDLAPFLDPFVKKNSFFLVACRVTCLLRVSKTEKNKASHRPTAFLSLLTADTLIRKMAFLHSLHNRPVGPSARFLWGTRREVARCLEVCTFTHLQLPPKCPYHACWHLQLVRSWCHHAFSKNHLPKTSIPLAENLQIFFVEDAFLMYLCKQTYWVSPPLIASQPAIEKEHRNPHQRVILLLLEFSRVGDLLRKRYKICYSKLLGSLL